MSQEQSATFEPSYSAASDQGRMVESSAESFTKKKPKILYKSNGVTIYYRKNMRTVDYSWTAKWHEWAHA